MKKLTAMFLAMLMCLSAVFGAFGSEVNAKTYTDYCKEYGYTDDDGYVPGLKVRVNSFLVDFPDAKPFVDENNRTLIPVRFVSEQLGATVEWNNSTQTASISLSPRTLSRNGMQWWDDPTDWYKYCLEHDSQKDLMASFGPVPYEVFDENFANAREAQYYCGWAQYGKGTHFASGQHSDITANGTTPEKLNAAIRDEAAWLIESWSASDFGVKF